MCALLCFTKTKNVEAVIGTRASCYLGTHSNALFYCVLLSFIVQIVYWGILVLIEP